MIGIYKQKNPANVVLLLLLGLLLKWPLLMHPRAVLPDPADGALYRALLDGLAGPGRQMPWIYSLLSLLLLFTQALQLQSLLNRHRMMSRPNYLPAMAYLLITSLFPEWNYFSAPLLINTLLLAVFGALFRSYTLPDARALIFNAGLVMGLASFIYLPSFSFLLWILLAIAVMRPFRLVEWVLCVTGSLTPFYFYAVWLFLTDRWNWQDIIPSFALQVPRVEPTLWLAGGTALLLIPFLIGGYYIQENLRKMLIQVRKGWSLFLLFLLGAILIPFLSLSPTLDSWILVAIPFAAFHGSGYLYATFRIIPLLLFWLSLLYVVAYQYAGPGW